MSCLPSTRGPPAGTEPGGTPYVASATIATAAGSDPEANPNRMLRGTTCGSAGQGFQLHAHPVEQAHVSKAGIRERLGQVVKVTSAVLATQYSLAQFS